LDSTAFLATPASRLRWRSTSTATTIVSETLIAALLQKIVELPARWLACRSQPPGRAIDTGSAHRSRASGAVLPGKPRAAPAGAGCQRAPGAWLADMIRTRVMLTDITRWREGRSRALATICSGAAGLHFHRGVTLCRSRMVGGLRGRRE